MFSLTLHGAKSVLAFRVSPIAVVALTLAFAMESQAAIEFNSYAESVTLPAVDGSAHPQAEFTKGGVYCFQFEAPTNSAAVEETATKSDSGAASQSGARVSRSHSHGSAYSSSATNNPSGTLRDLVPVVAKANAAGSSSANHTLGSSGGGSSFGAAANLAASNVAGRPSTNGVSANSSPLQSGNYQLAAYEATDSFAPETYGESPTVQLAMALQPTNSNHGPGGLANWSSSYGSTTGNGSNGGDFNGDQSVNGFDFLSWQRQPDPNNPAAISGAPEPSAFCIWLITAAGAIATRSSRRRSA